MEAAEDLEAGRQKKRLHAEPTLPIYLKVNTHTNIYIFDKIGPFRFSSK